ncbi:hypothetical protein BD769DRAFT_1697592 [Suillus cothurnatus]|nr:hypothetical protein BD769DRAFT_1697592 [Suillus cothurnatus]
MHNYSFNIPNEPRAQEHSVQAGEPNLEVEKGLKVQDEGLEAEESGLKAGEFNLEAGEADIKAGDWDIEAGEADIEARDWDIEAGDQDIEAENPPTLVLNPKETYQDYHLELNGKICDEHDPHTMVHNMLANRNFKDEMEYAPYREWKGEGDDTKWQWHNVMSGDWAWNQAPKIQYYH